MIKLKLKLSGKDKIEVLQAVDRILDNYFAEEERMDLNLYLTTGKPIKIRSSKQNAYYWGVVLKTIKDHSGIDSSQLHRVCAFKFNLETMTFPSGEVVEIPGKTKSLDTAKFSEYLDNIREWAMHEFGIFIPSPNEMPEEAYMEFLEREGGDD